MKSYIEAQLNGKRAEDIFLEKYSVKILRKGTERENKYDHIDFVLKDGRTVDVKSNTKIREDGLVCVEIINVTGGIGWCHPLSRVDLIAFQLKDESFKIVLKRDLLSILNCTIPREVRRADRIPAKELVGKVGGRKTSKYLETNKDVFTYVELTEILKLKDKL